MLLGVRHRNSLYRSVHQVRTPRLSLCAFLNGIKLWTIINYSSRPNCSTCTLPYKLMLRLNQLNILDLCFWKSLGERSTCACTLLWALSTYYINIRKGKARASENDIKQAKWNWTSIQTLQPNNTQWMTDVHIQVQTILPYIFKICIFSRYFDLSYCTGA